MYLNQIILNFKLNEYYQLQNLLEDRLTYSTAIICAVSFVTSLVDLGHFKRFGAVSSFLSLTPNLTITKYQFWRILTTHFICPSLWNTLFVGMVVFFNGSQVEMRLTTGRFIAAICICLLCISLIGLIFAAFFGLVPGINYWSYFANFWYDTTAVGPTTLIILLSFFEARINQRKTIQCCCLSMPTWLYLVILVAICQFILFPPWKGIWYTFSDVIIALAYTQKLFGELKTVNAPLQQGVLQRGQQQQQQPAPIQIINSNEPADVDGAKNQQNKFIKQVRKLVNNIFDTN